MAQATVRAMVLGCGQAMVQAAVQNMVQAMVEAMMQATLYAVFRLSAGYGPGYDIMLWSSYILCHDLHYTLTAT